MAKFKMKPMILEAVSFDELMEYGRNHTTNVYNNMPWSFDFMGHAVTHETDDCYFIATKDEEDIVFTRNKMLILENNHIDVIDVDQFELMCEPLGE